MSQTPQELFILPFDHRGTFEQKIFNINGRKPNALETKEISKFKEIIFQAYLKSIHLGVSKEHSGILVDEQYGSSILTRAAEGGYNTACTIEKSGQDEFDFEYGEEFRAHIAKMRATYAKVLVRFNPENDFALNQRQMIRLKKLSDYCHGHGTKLMLELLVPPTKSQLEKSNQRVSVFDQSIRPDLMLQSMRMIQDFGIEADLWKVEGTETREDCLRIAAQARAGGAQRANVGLIILGRGENGGKVEHWLKTAASVDGFIGFAVGRTVFWESITAFHAGQINEETSATKIAETFTRYCNLWHEAKRVSR